MPREIEKVLIVGLGEVGEPLSEIVSGVYPKTYVYDIKQGERKLPYGVDVMHICFPYSQNFIKETVGYVAEVEPKLLLIESTVPPGTTSAISIVVGEKTLVAHSPVNGRVADGMKFCLYNYTKFIGPASKEAGEMAERYYQSLGFKTKVLSSPWETEFAKIIDLAYFAVMLGWNQEMRRITEKFKINFDEIAEFLKDVTIRSGYRFPRPVYDGKPIGGHCIIPAVEMLNSVFPSKFLEAVLESNREVSKCTVKGKE
jgi:UDP-N-acetyl-D-mannosaminuronate dehydrogenase